MINETDHPSRARALLKKLLASPPAVDPGGKTAKANPGATGATACTTKLVPPEIYYDNDNTYYWMRNKRGRFVKLTKSDVEKHLIASGYNPRCEEDESLSDVATAIMNVQHEHDVNFVGSLAGHGKGLAVFGDVRCLITSEPTFIVPMPGDWSMLRGVLARMFGNIQLHYFFGWIKIALEMFAAGSWLAGQALIMCGPPGAGKNLVTALLQRLFGGRVGKPYRYMTGRTEFNSDFLGAELLTIEDEAESATIQARRAFGANIKMLTVNETQRLHPKNKQALAVTVLCRLVVSLNDEPDRIMIVPPLDEDIEDKIILLKVTKHPMPMPTSSAAEQKGFMNALQAQLPAFVHFLESWKIPDGMKSDRFGVKHFHHPMLLSALAQHSPEERLMELIDEYLFASDFRGNSWSGAARKLERELKDHKNARCAREAEKVVSSSMACGRYLARLAKMYPDRVASRSGSGHTTWTIFGPPDVQPCLPPAAPKISLELLQRMKSQPPQNPDAASDKAS